MRYKTLVSAETLHNHLDDRDWVVVDCRFDLSNPNWGALSYSEKHIPGAVYAHLDRDLSGSITESTGRHPLPGVEKLAALFGEWGVKKNSQVVAYDTTGGSFADRLWWLLRYLGHQDAAVLDGGFVRWEQLGYPVSAKLSTRPPGLFYPDVNNSLLVDAKVVDHIRLDPQYKLIDARAAERFSGEKEPIDPVAGHIPGAGNRFHGTNLQLDGTFKSPEVLRSEYESLLGGTPPGNVIVYCGSGVTSCHHILAMEIAGIKGAKLYPGSWSEWIRDPDHAIAKKDMK